MIFHLYIELLKKTYLSIPEYPGRLIICFKVLEFSIFNLQEHITK